LGLDAAKPLIVHAMGVANGVEEHYGALDLARRICDGELRDAQLIVRPHPFNNHHELSELFRPFAPRVVLQQYTPGEARSIRSQNEQETEDWVNTFRHADVVVHLSSTVAIDAALFDRPSVCMDYDPAPGQPRQAIVRDVNHRWTHYRPVAESGGTWLVNNPQQLVDAIRTYLAHPELHRMERQKMAEYVCGYLDGRCGRRMIDAVIDFMNVRVLKAKSLSETYAR
jgi:CDP-glycerol glycerophosphotransferase (TagB/SpsB family)